MEQLKYEEKEVEITEQVEPKEPVVVDNDLMKKSKKDLISMIEAEQLKYKKLKTSKNRIAKEVKELEEDKEQDTQTLLTLTEAVGLANDEAASMSEQLRIKNSTMKVVTGALRDYLTLNDIARRNLEKILISMGVSLTGDDL